MSLRGIEFERVSPVNLSPVRPQIASNFISQPDQINIIGVIPRERYDRPQVVGKTLPRGCNEDVEASLVIDDPESPLYGCISGCSDHCVWAHILKTQLKYQWTDDGKATVQENFLERYGDLCNSQEYGDVLNDSKLKT